MRRSEPRRLACRQPHGSGLIRRCWVFLILLVVYCGVYLWLSRSGYSAARKFSVYGFYYVPPSDTTGWRSLNNTCIMVFSPLNAVDPSLGTGMDPDPCYPPLRTVSDPPHFSQPPHY
jgi:hypothetical protein